MKHKILINVAAYVLGNVQEKEIALPIVPNRGEILIGIERLFTADDFLTADAFDHWAKVVLDPNRDSHFYVREVIHYVTENLCVTHLCLDETTTMDYIKNFHQ